MTSIFFYLNGIELLKASKSRDFSKSFFDELIEHIYNNNIHYFQMDWDKKEMFLPIELKKYSYIQLVEIPSNLTVFSRGIELNNIIDDNINSLEQQDQDILNLIRENTFEPFQSIDFSLLNENEINIYNLFKDITGKKILTPRISNLVLEMWYKNNINEKVKIFLNEDSFEYVYLTLWIELLENVVKKKNIGLIHHWF